jgi:excisionase family DNA binding protein
MTILPRMLRPKEVAEWLGISESMAYGMMRRGEIPSVPVRSYLRVREDKLMEWLDVQEETRREMLRATDEVAEMIRRM